MPIELSYVFALLCAVWLVFFIFGRRQLERVKRATLDLVLTQAASLKRQHQEPSIEEFYALLQPGWEAMLRQSARFVTHKTELFPIPATPAAVRRRLNFTPAWLGAYLRLNGYRWAANPELEPEIERILALAPVRPRR